MPYNNVPEHMWGKMDSCVEELQKQGHDKSSAIAICHESVVGKKEVSIPPVGATMQELIAIAKTFFTEPITDKASVSQGGGPRGTPSGGQPTSSQGYHDAMQERCFIHMKKLVGDEAMARKMCKDAADMMMKESRLTQKASDSPGDYLIVEDREKPTTWHLQVRTNGTPDHRLMGAAWAALHGGYRGNKYEGPNKQEAIGKLRRMYESENMPVPSEKSIRYRKREKAITDAPNLRGEDARNCMNCKYYRLVDYPSEPMMMADTPDQEGICAQYEFLTNADWVCDAWEEIPPIGVAMSKESDLSIVKQKDGSYRWFLTTSSSYRDHDGEIVSQKAQEDDTARMNATGRFGVVNWWHWYRHNGQWKKSKELSSFELQEATPLRLGTCDLSGMQGRMRIESGIFDDAFVAERMATRQKELGASLEFLHSVNDPDADGIYHSITTLARAILPKERASNKLTQLIVAKESTVSILDSISKALGGDNAAQEKAKEIIQSVENADKAAQVARLESKETTEQKEPPKEESTEESKQPVFAGDIPISEFKEILNAAVVQFLTPAVKEISEQVRKMSDAQVTTQKETGDRLTASIKSVQDMQTDLAARLAALEGLTPRAYRVTQDPQTVIAKETAKERGPKSDAQAEATLANWLASTK